MPQASVILRPGADTELTPTYDQAAYDDLDNGRFRAGVFEKLGGWTKYVPFIIDGDPRELHAWQDLNRNVHLAAATTTILNVITDGSIKDISPQELLTEFEPVFVSTSTDETIEIDDSNISDVTTYDSVEFLTPVSIGGIILSGLYPIATITGTTSYTIEARAAATLTRANAGITDITNANPAVVTYSGADNFANGDLVYLYDVGGMTEVNNLVFTVANVDTGANTFELSGIDSSLFSMYTTGGIASPAQVPEFTTTLDSAIISVRLQAHGQSVGNTVVLPLATTVGGLTIEGKYSVIAVTSVDVFTISANEAASSTATAMMNDGEVALRYYITLTPGAAGLGYGLGDYGDGPYGIGGTPSSNQTGTAIAATNWTLDNWGELLIANIENEGIYYWGPTEGLTNAKLIDNAPIYNSGAFVSQSIQQIIAYGSSINAYEGGGIGVFQDPLLVQWCDISDFNQWTPGASNFARNFRIPTGSEIIGGCATKNRNLIWTDLELWTFTFINLPDVYSPNKIGDNCGLIGKHAFALFAGSAYWMGKNNFFTYSGAGVQTIPCPVWDYVFQDIDRTNERLCVAGSNSDFTEIWFWFPSASGGLGYPDKFVKYNTIENTWEIGVWGRLAWIDRSVLGNPVGFNTDGTIYSHENGYDDDGDPLISFFTTTYFSINEAQDFATVDRIIPDFKYGTIEGDQDAQIEVTVIYAEDPNDTPIENGPYMITSSSPTITLDPPIRAKLLALKCRSSDIGSFWRLGRIRFRYAPDGRV